MYVKQTPALPIGFDLDEIDQIEKSFDLMVHLRNFIYSHSFNCLVDEDGDEVVTVSDLDKVIETLDNLDTYCDCLTMTKK